MRTTLIDWLVINWLASVGMAHKHGSKLQLMKKVKCRCLTAIPLSCCPEDTGWVFSVPSWRFCTYTALLLPAFITELYVLGTLHRDCLPLVCVCVHAQVHECACMLVCVCVCLHVPVCVWVIFTCVPVQGWHLWCFSQSLFHLTCWNRVSHESRSSCFQ